MRWWPFNKPETRADATVQVVERIETEALYGTLGDSLAIAEAAAGMWERCLSSATVEPQSNRLQGLGPAFLALVGRALAVRGNMVAAIEVQGSRVRLLPASGYDLQGGTDPETWRYRVDLTGPDMARTLTLPGASVLHFRTGAPVGTPWRGVAPLRRSTATARVAVRLEKVLDDELHLPVSRLVPFQLEHGSFEGASETANMVRKGGLVFTGDRARTDRETVKIGPDPSTALEPLRLDTGRDILSAFGVPPALFEARGDGSGQRESWRRFWLGTIAPLARMIEAECREKLDPACIVSLDALRAADVDANSRAVTRRAQAYKTFRDAQMDDAEARRLAGLD